MVQRILYFIKEWKVALTDMSRHKDDLVHIKDMYRLLRFKGKLYIYFRRMMNKYTDTKSELRLSIPRVKRLFGGCISAFRCKLLLKSNFTRNLTPSCVYIQSLKSAHELEEEDRVAQSAVSFFFQLDIGLKNLLFFCIEIARIDSSW